MKLHDVIPFLAVGLTFVTLSLTYFIRRWSPSTIGLLLVEASALYPAVSELICSRSRNLDVIRLTFQMGFSGEILSGGILLLFSLVFARKNPWEDQKRRGPALLAIGALLLATISYVVVVPDLARIVAIEPSDVLFIPWSNMTVISFFLMALLLLGLSQMAKTYLSATGLERWNIKYTLIGVGMWPVSLLIIHANQLLNGGFDRSFLLINDVGLILMNGFLLYTLLVQKAEDVTLSPSRNIINRSVLLLLAGGSLLAMGGLTTTFERLGPNWNKLSTDLTILAGIACFLIVFSSDRLRRELESFLGVHFYASRYDYRSAWMTLTRALTESTNVTELLPTLMEQTREITFADILIYCSVTGEAPLALSAQKISGWTPPIIDGKPIVPTESQVAILREGIPIHLSDIPSRSDMAGEASSWTELFLHLNVTWVLPLVRQGTLIGLLGLSGKPYGQNRLFEDRLFLQALSVQWVGLLTNASLSRELAWSREADLFSGLKAFTFHDLKNAGISLKLLLHNAQKNMDDRDFQKELLESLKNISSQIEGTVDQFLNPFRLEYTNQTSFDLNALLSSTIKNLHWEVLPFMTTEISLGILPLASGNPKAVESAIQNLLINAREAMNDRGHIRIESRNDENGWAVLTIADNGPGMSQDFLENRLFRPFQTTKRKGSGLGLFSTKLLIEQNGGKILVHSQEGNGTVFTLRIPTISGSLPIYTS